MTDTTTGTDLFGSSIPAPRVQGITLSKTTSTDQWLTPPDLLARLGPFDTDPCSPINRPWPTATQHWTIADDGLRMPWTGTVWLNPPFSQAARWLTRLAEHADGIALLHARTDTAMWHDHVFPHATCYMFLRKRVHFHTAEGKRAAGNSGAPVVLIGYGQHALDRLRDAQDLGALLVPDPDVRDAA